MLDDFFMITDLYSLQNYSEKIASEVNMLYCIIIAE